MIYKRIILFFSSFVLAYIFLIIERYFGFDWNYHPDSITYITRNNFDINFYLNNPLFLINNSYYFLVYLANFNISILIFINIVCFSFTNVLIFNYLYNSNYTFLNKLLLLLILFNPYKIHLSVHILKDTLLIFFLVLAYIYGKKFLILPYFLSIRSFFYLLVFVEKKLYIYFIIFLFFTLISFDNLFSNWVYGLSNHSFHFREYDTIPNFSNLGNYGFWIRAFIWPFFYLTGLFIFFSSSPLFLFLFFGQVVNLIFTYSVLRLSIFDLRIYFILFFFAIIISGFTTYFRYCFPLIILMPLLLMRKRTNL
jgi:hypothetical protein